MDDHLAEAIRAMGAARLRFEDEAQRLEEQRRKLEAATEAAEAARAEHDASAKDFADRLDRLLAIRDMRYEDGSAVVDFAAGALAHSLADSLGNARNYVEVYLRHPTEPGESLAVLIRRRHGKQPAECLAEIRKAANALLAEIEGHDECPACDAPHDEPHLEDCLAQRLRELCWVPSNVPGTDLPVPD